MEANGMRRIHYKVNGEWFENFLVAATGGERGFTAFVREAIDGLPSISPNLVYGCDDAVAVTANCRAAGLRYSGDKARRLLEKIAASMSMMSGVYGDEARAAVAGLAEDVVAISRDAAVFAEGEWEQRMLPFGPSSAKRDRSVFLRLDADRVASLDEFARELGELTSAKIKVDRGRAIGVAVMCRVAGIGKLGASPSGRLASSFRELNDVLGKVNESVLDRDGAAGTTVAARGAVNKCAGSVMAVLLGGQPPRAAVVS